MTKRIIYIGRSRLHRNRANLIQTLNTVAALRDCGADITLYLPSWPSNCVLADKLASLGIAGRLDVRASRLLHSTWQPWGTRLFCRLRKEQLLRADMVFARSPDISLALIRAGIPHAFEVHEAQSLLRSPRYREIIAHHQAGLVTHLFPISSSARDILLQAGGRDERITVVPSGVSLEAFERIRPFNPQNLRQATTVYLGRLSRNRGLDILFGVARAGLAKVILVGDAEDVLPEDVAIEVHPFVPHRDVPAWYEKSDLVLLPYQEFLPQADSISPVKLFEAMAAGRPIIASDIPPVREILTHDENALLVPAADVAAWCDAIRSLVADPQRALRLALRAKARAAEFTWRVRAGKILAVCQQTAGPAASCGPAT